MEVLHVETIDHFTMFHCASLLRKQVGNYTKLTNDIGSKSPCSIGSIHRLIHGGFSIACPPVHWEVLFQSSMYQPLGTEAVDTGSMEESSVSLCFDNF